MAAQQNQQISSWGVDDISRKVAQAAAEAGIEGVVMIPTANNS